jgi:GntR family transcriptional regulator, transcriptional repressor for pyruvate dehydrogenase complex
MSSQSLVTSPVFRAPKMGELIAADIRRKIVSGELVPGQSLPSEADMMRGYEIARPTLREALRLLEQDQLLTVRRGSHLGWTVRLPDPSLTARNVTLLLELEGATLGDVYTARTIFEPPACRMAAEHAPEEEIERLRRTLEEELAADDDRAVYPVVAWRFHTELAELSGNKTLGLIGATLQHISQSHAARMVSTRWDKTVWRRSYRAHEKVIDLISARKGAEAEAFWRKHMQLAGEQLLRDLGDLPISEVV